MIKRIYEVILAVEDMDAAVEKYSQILGIRPWGFPESVMPQPGGMKAAVFHLGGHEGTAWLGLMASTRKGSDVDRFIERRGEGVYAVAYQVTDLEQDMKELASKGIRLIYDKPQEFIAGRYNIGHSSSFNGVHITTLAEHPRPLKEVHQEFGFKL